MCEYTHSVAEALIQWPRSELTRRYVSLQRFLFFTPNGQDNLWIQRAAVWSAGEITSWRTNKLVLLPKEQKPSWKHLSTERLKVKPVSGSLKKTKMKFTPEKDRVCVRDRASISICIRGAGWQQQHGSAVEFLLNQTSDSSFRQCTVSCYWQGRARCVTGLLWSFQIRSGIHRKVDYACTDRSTAGATNKNKVLSF